MKKHQPGQEDRQAEAEDAVILLQRAMTQSPMLRKGFGLCASRRSDAGEWRLLENEAAVFLERHLDGTLDGKADWFSAADRGLKGQMTEFLARAAPHSDRAGHYRRAADNLIANAESWAEVLGVQACYWRHAALVWMALWHAADTQGVPVERARNCLFDALSLVPATVADSGRAVPRWYEAPGRFAASLLNRA